MNKAYTCTILYYTILYSMKNIVLKKIYIYIYFLLPCGGGFMRWRLRGCKGLSNGTQGDGPPPVVGGLFG